MKGKIFNAQEVQSILNKSKVMFREVIKTPIYWRNDENSYFFGKEKMNGYPFQWTDKCPYQVGQKIFCKETYEEWDDGLVYKADNSPANIVSKWKPAQHMKQEHSRLTLRIKSVKVKRLAEISDEDCWKEGLDTSSNYADYAVRQSVKEGKSEVGAKDYFREKWNSTHKKPEEKFEANPWVWVVNFEVVKKMRKDRRLVLLEDIPTKDLASLANNWLDEIDVLKTLVAASAIRLGKRPKDVLENGFRFEEGK